MHLLNYHHHNGYKMSIGQSDQQLCVAHFRRQQECMLTLHALAYIVRHDRNIGRIWNYATANPKSVSLTQLRGSAHPCKHQYQPDMEDSS